RPAGGGVGDAVSRGFDDGRRRRGGRDSRRHERRRCNESSGCQGKGFRGFGDDGGVHVAYCRFGTLRSGWRGPPQGNGAAKPTSRFQPEAFHRPYGSKNAKTRKFPGSSCGVLEGGLVATAGLMGGYARALFELADSA